MMHNTRSRVEGSRLAHFDAVSFETVADNAPVQFYDDFLGAGFAAALPTSATAGNPWVAKTIQTGGTPTVAGLANGVGGQITVALDATSEAQTALLYFADQLNFDVTKGLVFETRVKLSVLPSVAAARAVFGLQAAYNAAPDSVGFYLEFGATGSGAINVRNQDGTTQASTASGVTVLATEWHIYRIDTTDVTNIRFYIDGTDVTPATAVPFVATGASAVLQPVVQVYKASGTGVASAVVDYVKVWTNRT